jgi:lipooligosaccharide transport system ATP-binding protein
VSEASTAPRTAGPPQEASADQRASLIHARGLTKSFGDFTAVDGIDLDVMAGEAFGFLGPNGAGKTSTMRMIGCISPVGGGLLRVLGLDPATHGVEIRARLGVVPQADTLDPELTVHENLVIYGRYFNQSRAEARRRADELLQFVQLEEKGGARTDTLSGGMKRRVTIARGLINDPELLLLDEPTTGLDPQARHLVWERLYRLKQRGVTLLLTTHYMDEAEQLCDRVVVMDHGVLVAQGTPRQLIEQHSTREVVEVRLGEGDPLPPLTDAANSLIDRVEVLPDRVLVYTNDGEAAMGALVDAGLRPLSTLIRRASLEDVFLRLTGRSLEE